MALEPRLKNQYFILAIFLVFLVAGTVFLYQQQLSIKNRIRLGTACTQEAKICPDGSAVGRTGPNCEFAACSNDPYGTWKKVSDRMSGISFWYPENLPTKYTSTVDWPPKIQKLNQKYTCVEGGSEIAPAGQTQKTMINGREYCVTTESEGAAGSIYKTYTYAFPIDLQTVIFTFSLRFVQCGNYPEPQMTACENERQSFDLDNLVDRMARSINGQEAIPLTP